MAERLLKASSAGIKRLTTKLTEKQYTTVGLAADLKLPDEAIKNFLEGQEVERNIALEVCRQLNLAWQEILDTSNLKTAKSSTHPPSNNSGQPVQSPKGSPEGENSSIQVLVQNIKKQIGRDLRLECERIRILDMQKPVALTDIYVNTYVWTKIPVHRRLGFETLNQAFNETGNNLQSLAEINNEAIAVTEVINKHSKLLLTGKLGTGKTTLLRHLTMQSMMGKLWGDRVPLLISCQDFAETQVAVSSLTLGQYIHQFFSKRKLKDESQVTSLLEQGKFVLLFDDLDAVNSTDLGRVTRQIRDFSNFYPLNRFIVTTRSQSQPFLLEQFTEFELAEWNATQVDTFINKWLVTSPERISSYQQVITSNQRLRELSNNPLFLTAICIALDNAEDLNIGQICSEIFNLALQKWDAKRYINRDRLNLNLSITHKQDILSYLALTTIAEQKYLFEKNYLRHILSIYGHQAESLALTFLDSEALVECLEVQHHLLIQQAKDIYSFSHLALQEYLAAHRIINSDDLTKLAIDSITHIHNEPWLNLINFAVSLMPDPAHFLWEIKKQIDLLLAPDLKLQKFLIWIGQQVQSLKSSYKPVALRAYYLDMGLEKIRVLDRARAVDLAHSRTVERARLRALGQENELNTELDLDHTLTLALNLDLAMFFVQNPILVLARHLDTQVDYSLSKLSQQIPSLEDLSKFRKWWQVKGLEWAKDLREIIIQPRKSIQEWEFTEAQEQLLQDYHDANLFLARCLQQARYLNPEERNKIESALILPYKAKN